MSASVQLRSAAITDIDASINPLASIWSPVVHCSAFLLQSRLRCCATPCQCDILHSRTNCVIISAVHPCLAWLRRLQYAMRPSLTTRKLCHTLVSFQILKTAHRIKRIASYRSQARARTVSNAELDEAPSTSGAATVIHAKTLVVIQHIFSLAEWKTHSTRRGSLCCPLRLGKRPSAANGSSRTRALWR